MSDPISAHRLTPEPIMFSSPTFHGGNYSRVAFEADLPRIEDPDTAFDSPTCQRHVDNPSDPHPGRGCVSPPPHSNFYPTYSTTTVGGQCMWQEGGRYLAADRRFGGARRQYGDLLPLIYPETPYTTTTRYNDLRRILNGNPCRN